MNRATEGDIVSNAALFVVGLSGLYLVAFGVASFAAPGAVKRFLLGFATTASRHYGELAARLLVGGAFVHAAPRLPSAALHQVVGWGLLLTTAAMLLVPWRFHRAFAQRTVPAALPFLPVLGGVSLLAGCWVLTTVTRATP